MLTDILHTFFGPAIRISPTYIATFVLVAFFIFLFKRSRNGSGSFLSWLFPRDIYLHKSHFTDMKLFVFGRLLALTGGFTTIGLRTFVATAVVAGLAAMTGRTLEAGSWSVPTMLAVTLMIIVVADFASYWNHRIHHEMPSLWPFHAVHHSAEVMTPVTIYRKHPIYDLIGGLMNNLFLGVAIGSFLFLITNRIDALTLGGINAGYYLFNITLSNFRHSHIWISYGLVLEHVLVSPAQHQIHHSRAIEHHNKNYGEVFALWDWMFGSLYVPRGKEDLVFGLADANGVPIPQPHGSLREALLVPFRESIAVLRPAAQRTQAQGDAAPNPQP